MDKKSKPSAPGQQSKVQGVRHSSQSDLEAWDSFAEFLKGQNKKPVPENRRSGSYSQNQSVLDGTTANAPSRSTHHDVSKKDHADEELSEDRDLDDDYDVVTNAGDLEHGDVDLGAELWNALVESKPAASPWEYCDAQWEMFLPRDQHTQIVSRSRVRQELQDLRIFRDHDLDWYTDLICGEGDGDTRIAIFALLAMYNKTECIVDFINEGLHDADLPLKVSKHHGSLPRPITTKYGEPLSCFLHWGAAECDALLHGQWRVLAPKFEKRQATGDIICHYVLYSDELLPFTEAELVVSGSLADVYRVRIHPGHHDVVAGKLGEAQVTDLYAVKRLFRSTADEFSVEVAKHLRLDGLSPLRLKRLLFTYRHRGVFCLVFPWAEGFSQRDAHVFH